MNKIQSLKLSNNLHLVRVENEKRTVIERRPSVHHVIVTDVSGSMSYALPAMAQTLVDKLPAMVGEDDLVTCIWFSGKGEAGTIFEARAIADLRDLKKTQEMLKRWLKPVGLTGFVDPLREAARVMEASKKKLPKHACSLFFLSDGHDNQWDRPEIMRAYSEVLRFATATTIVEYGYYADRDLLSKMAAMGGGAYVFADDLAKYEVNLEAAMKGSPTPQVEIKIPSAAVGGIAFAMIDGSILSFGAAGVVSAREDVDAIYYLSESPAGESITSANDALYAALSLFATRKRPEIVLPILKKLGDVRFIRQYGSLFGKQAYTRFQEATREAVFDTAARDREGNNPNALPDDNALTVIEMLDVLSADEKATLLLEHPMFKYSRIGRKREDVTDDTVFEKLKFVPDASPDGFSVLNLVYNEDRANISMLVRKTGIVDLGGRMPFKGKVPEKFPTHIFRNYTIVRDGMCNIERLPVRARVETIEALSLRGIATIGAVTKCLDGRLEAVLDLSRMPVVNRAQVARTSSSDLTILYGRLTYARARQKVLRNYRDLLAPKTSDKLIAEYGEEATTWLAEQGITDGGFAPPHTKLAEAKDFYMGLLLTVKIKGFSSLPTVSEVIENKKKLNGPGTLMRLAVEEIEAHIGHKGALTEKDVARLRKDNLVVKYIEGACEGAEAQTKLLLRQAAAMKFPILAGGVWFHDAPADTAETQKVPVTVKIGSIDTVANIEVSEEKIFV